MNIGWAVGQLKDGRKVRRRVWADHEAVTDYCGMRLVSLGPGYLPVIMARTASDQEAAYTASHGDLLADDWELA